MAIGAFDYLEQLLVQKYALEQVDNHSENATVSKVRPDEMLGAMNEYAAMSRNMFVLSQKLNSTCYAVNAQNAKYRKAQTIEELA